MPWYYAKGSDKIGPLSDAEFEEHKKSGQLTMSSLVWKDGMADWVRLETLASPGSVCAECGKSYPESELISYQGHKICASCKGVFVQKLKEGLDVAGQLSYAGFWTRFGAVFVDGLIMGVLSIPVSLFSGALTAAAGQGDPLRTFAFQMIPMAFSLVLGVTYDVLMTGKYQATLGKMAAGIKVIGQDGGKISYALALGRYFAKWINYFTLFIGFMMAGWDPKKQALHDRICGTYVVKAKP